MRESYALGRDEREYERLRMQARVWESATERVLDSAGVGEGALCLDAGCGPGETMRQLAHRVGPSGRVVGIDVDADLGDHAVSLLQADGHLQCRFLRHDVTDDAPIPGAPYDLVYARLLLFHLPQRVAVLRRLWQAVRPGGHLVVQDYDLAPSGAVPALDATQEVLGMLVAAFTAAGCEVRAGSLLPWLFAEAGIGAPDATDVAGRLEPASVVCTMLEQTYRSVLPVAVRHRLVTEADAEDALAGLRREAVSEADRPSLWPLMVGAWKQKSPV
jgi:ubiquinone/menaquinone biosynthesis C-methylase UbiE